MPIPFPPDGPQVQAAMSKMSGGVLKNYAGGTPPQITGQVTPGPDGAAGKQLAARGASSAANQRQQAMNNKVSDSTIFQQKDMELAQKAQQLAAAEKQLGVKAALIDQMAQQARNAQMRDTMGVSTLPLPQDAFTAMRGGIVFAHGGGVEGYARRGLVQPDLGAFNEDRPSFVVPSKPESEDDSEIEESITNIRSGLASLKEARERAMLSPKEKKRRLEEAETKDRGQYEKYKTGIAGLDDETAAAIRGKPANTMQGIAAGLAALPADLRGVRIAGLMTKLAGGVAGERAKAEERENKAAMYMAEAKRKQALADFEEERGRTKRANELVASAEADLEKAYRYDKDVITAEVGAEEKIAGLRQRKELSEAKLAAAKELQAERLKSADTLLQVRMKAYEDRTNLMHQVQLAKIEAAKAGEGKTDLQVSARVIEAKLKEANAKLPQNQRLSDALIKDQAFKDATNLIYGYRNVNAAASQMRASTANAKNVSEALRRLKFDSEYMEATPERKRQIEDGERARFSSSGATPQRSATSSDGDTTLKFDAKGNLIP